MNAFLYPVPAQSPLEGEQIIVQYGKDWRPIILDIVLRLRRVTLWNSPPDDLDDLIQDLSYALSAEITIGGNVGIVGEVRMIASLTIPDSWLLCHGQSLLRADYPDLFTAIGSVFGAVDGSHFNIPDFRNMFPVGADPILTNGGIAHTGGENTVTLTEAQIPTHTHTGVVSLNNALSNRAVVSSGGAQNVRPAGTSDSAGSGQAHENRPPFLALEMMIYTGI